MEFIETTVFTKHVSDYLSEDEYAGLQLYLSKNPESGRIIQRSGGIRKIRWAYAGKGKSGGVRVIYYYRRTESEIWLLTIYSKSEIETIPVSVLRQIAKEIDYE